MRGGAGERERHSDGNEESTKRGRITETDGSGYTESEFESGRKPKDASESEVEPECAE